MTFKEEIEFKEDILRETKVEYVTIIMKYWDGFQEKYRANKRDFEDAMNSGFEEGKRLEVFRCQEE